MVCLSVLQMISYQQYAFEDDTRTAAYKTYRKKGQIAAYYSFKMYTLKK